MIFSNPSQSRESYLIIEWDRLSLSYSIFHEESNRVLYSLTNDLPFDLHNGNAQELKRFIKEQEIFAFHYKKVICIISSPYYTLVPSLLSLSDAEKEDILRFNIDLSSGNFKTMSERIQSTRYDLLFVVPDFVNDTFTQSFPNLQIRHLNAVLLQALTYYKHAETLFYIHLSNEVLTVSYWAERKLLYHNSFTIQAAEDVVYYTLNVVHELQLNNERMTLYYSGGFNDNDRYLTLLSQYIKFLKPLERSHKINYSPKVEALAPHLFVHHYANCL